MGGHIRGRRTFVACVLAAVAAIAVPGAGALSQDEHLPGAVISNGTVALGVNDHGQLNFAPPEGALVGVHYVATGNDGTRAGCLCEGWGAGARTGGESFFQGRANLAAGVNGVSLVSFSATESTATSVVDVIDGETTGLRVTHAFAPSPQTPNLYEIVVTLENPTAGTLSDVRYARQMDWDIEPTEFEEYVTVNRGAPPATLLYSDDDGFADNYPFNFTSDGPIDPATVNTSYVDKGPEDHGARFVFGFGSLEAGEKLSFRLYSGAAGTKTDADAAVSAAALEVFSYGKPSGEGGLETGAPNTFIWGFRAVGGTAVIPPTLTLTPGSATNPLGAKHTVTAEVKDSAGRPVPGAPLVFEVTGAHQSTSTATTGEDGRASLTYTGTASGTDTIRACLDANQSNSCDSTEVSATAQKSWGDGAATGSADVGVTISASPEAARVGQQITYTLLASNAGPFPAPGTVVTVQLPGSVAFVSASASKGSCSGGATTSCSLGTMEVGESATVVVVGTAVAGGTAVTQAGIGTASADPNVAANNSAAATVTVTGGALPEPEPGKGNVAPVAGRVLVNGRVVEGPVELSAGDVVNVSQGTLQLETVNGTAQFARGTFRFFDLPSASVLRRAGMPSGGLAEEGITELRLHGGNFKRACTPPKRRLSTHAPPRKTRVRSLWGNASGSFRTRGRHSAATVRGTVWYTADRCDGTLTRVREGSVLVNDFRRKRTVIVRAGKTYLAKAANPRHR